MLSVSLVMAKILIQDHSTAVLIVFLCIINQVFWFLCEFNFLYN